MTDIVNGHGVKVIWTVQAYSGILTAVRILPTASEGLKTGVCALLSLINHNSNLP